MDLAASQVMFIQYVMLILPPCVPMLPIILQIYLRCRLLAMLSYLQLSLCQLPPASGCTLFESKLCIRI